MNGITLFYIFYKRNKTDGSCSSFILFLFSHTSWLLLSDKAVTQRIFVV